MFLNVVHNSKLPICLNYIRRVAILTTIHSHTLASHSLQHYSTANLLFVRAHADEIDWRFNGRSFTKSGRGQAKNFAALRTPNNTNPPFQNPGSVTAPHSLTTCTHHSLTIRTHHTLSHYCTCTHHTLTVSLHALPNTTYTHSQCTVIHM